MLFSSLVEHIFHSFQRLHKIDSYRMNPQTILSRKTIETVSNFHRILKNVSKSSVEKKLQSTLKLKINLIVENIFMFLSFKLSIILLKKKTLVSSVKFAADREDDGPRQVQATKSQVDAPSSDYNPPPPAHTYAFPPNSNALYPPPEGSRKPISVSSYLPPPSGPTNYPIFPGPLTPKPISSLHTQADNSDSTDSMNGVNDMSEMNGSSNNDDDNNDDDNGNSSNPNVPSSDKPPGSFVPNKRPNFPSFPFLDSDSHNHNHEHEHIHDHQPHDHEFYDHAPFPSYDDSLKHLHGFEAFPGKKLISFFHNILPFDSMIYDSFKYV